MISNTMKVSLPSQRGPLKRIAAHHRMEHYYRLAFSLGLVNMACLIYGLMLGSWWSASSIDLHIISHFVIGNFSIAILIRQQYVVNILFWVATRAPTSWPLSIRRTLGKVYHFGGLHSGGAVVGTIWFAVFSGSLIYSYQNQLANISFATVLCTISLLLLLLFIIVMAMPWMRSLHHNAFEMTHRFGGWLALVLFWAQSVLFIQDQQQSLAYAPSFWLLILITVSIALPWLRLRKVKVDIERPSSHVAHSRFNYGVKPFAGSSTAISRSPLLEWHSFANVPAPNEDGFRLTISRAGDWTGEFIDDMPSHVWVKGIPCAGVANIEVLFKRVIYVATGSGIGPCLPHLLAKQVPSLLVWATRTPRETYGDKLVDEILDVQPDAVIWDTTSYGKPDMLKLAYSAYQAFNAEAVICIANQKLTRQVVYGMESRGIPAYGAIWDS